MDNEQILPWYLKQATLFRLNLPEEAAYPWLTFLLDAYALIDASVEEAIKEKRANNEVLACKNSCDNCCYQTIPISPVEAMGIRLLITKLLPKVEKEKLTEQLKLQQGNINWHEGQCPFLLESSCTIYPLRPIACRRYLVANTACHYRGEDVKTTRPNDLLTPDRGVFYGALAHTSPVYSSLGISKKNVILSFDNFKELFIDIRSIKWTE